MQFTLASHLPCSPGYLGISNLPVSAPKCWGLQAYVTTPGYSAVVDFVQL